MLVDGDWTDVMITGLWLVGWFCMVGRVAMGRRMVTGDGETFMTLRGISASSLISVKNKRIMYYKGFICYLVVFI